jgi:hypothetical protein
MEPQSTSDSYTISEQDFEKVGLEPLEFICAVNVKHFLFEGLKHSEVLQSD